ncbi:hypothetical protein ABMA27_007808 [Loxostege sticticalis]|uniref:Regulatory protein zeste n=1 Tax=Loxostege sticticalis TaxID=481309 RepID=A0ABR3HCY5_LOXSC
MFSFFFAEMTATHEQIEMLLQFLQEHTGLAKGHINSPDARAHSKRLWAELTDQLKSLGGAVKTTKQWQKVWADRKYLSKKAAAACRRAQTGTGGGPSTQPPLSEIEQKVVAIMGEGFGLPQTSATIPPFPNNDQLLNEEFKENIASNGQDEVPSTSASASTAASATAASATVPGTAFAAASASGTAAAFAAASGAASAAADPPSAPSTSRLPPRRPRLRFRRQPEDVRSQLVRLEERKIDELAGLRQEVKELTSTLRECLEHFKKQN